MSAINTIAIQNLIVFPRTRGACACTYGFAEEAIQQAHEPVVTARWGLETDENGKQHLVRRWFPNEATKLAKEQQR